VYLTKTPSHKAERQTLVARDDTHWTASLEHTHRASIHIICSPATFYQPSGHGELYYFGGNVEQHQGPAECSCCTYMVRPVNVIRYQQKRQVLHPTFNTWADSIHIYWLPTESN